MSGFTIVGIGASAGGLEAFRQLLEHLPGDTGLGFVFVQHLDPSHKSALAALLAKATPMKVREAVGGMTVEPNNVYIIPPNAEISIEAGILKLRRRVENVPRRSVDAFFESLAKDCGERAVGVILSGTATDGTFGLEAIKAEGGITIAQDASAKYDGMPTSAVNAGCVDVVLSPKAIAAELVRIARHPFLEVSAEDAPQAPGKPGKPGKPGHYEKIVLLLRNHTGVDFSRYKPATLQRRINRRMILLKLGELDAYVQRLRSDAAERDALYQDVLISVTGFFRNPDAFRALSQEVFPKLFKGRGAEDPVRVWVAGCAAGQEVYSIAMLLLEFMGDPRRAALQIYATDLNEAVLEKARAGFYPPGLLQDVSPERLRRFFTEEKGGYRVNKSIRDMCVFAKHDLISDPPFSRMDLISCRNLLIYLDPEVQKKVIPSFHYALKPSGALFLGASETVGGFAELFTSVDKKQRIYAKIPGPSRPLHFSFALHRAHGEKPAAPEQSRAPEYRELDIQREADRVTLSKYAPPSVLINDAFEVLQFRGATGPFLQPPRGKASFNLLKMAREGLLLPLRTAVNAAKRDNRRVRRADVPLELGGRTRKLNLEVMPLKNLKERCFLVFFDTGTRPAEPPPPAAAPKGRPLTARGEAREVERLATELSETRDYLQSFQEQYEAAHEELQASSEEVQSSNEELQSINEELETSKEELESSNEELTTVNEEMGTRNAELTRMTGDLNNLLANVDAAILLLGRDLRIERFTPPAQALFNLMATDVGRPLRAVKSNIDFPELEKYVSEVVSTVGQRATEVRDRAGRWFSLRARPYLAVDNKVDGAVLTIVDITDLKRSLEKTKAVVEVGPPMLLLDTGLFVRKANRTFCEAFRLSLGEIENRPLFEMGGGQWDIPKLRKLLQGALPRDKGVADFEFEHAFKDLGTRTILVNARELEWGDEDRMIVLSLLDITDRKIAVKEVERQNVELERRVRQRTLELTASNEELEAFCYSVAHDLRTPLRGIEGFSRILSKNHAASLDEQAKNYCERIAAATTKMSHLIDSLLDLARLTRAEMRHVPVDLSGLARSILEELAARQPGRKVELVVAPGLKTGGDDRLLRIALSNLFENAWKFTSKHEKARIEFGAAERGGETVYFVRDDGAGFDMVYADKLFQTFQRLHTVDEFPGTGVGLTIVQRIIKRHGGRIWADGGVERGATFFFSLIRPDEPPVPRNYGRRATDKP
ncbi:MAG: PAS domain-containing protein [Elusimicrobia bacterium]|nr:PAS domain-containing protein [Elusimicrobiota bacterium]